MEQFFDRLMKDSESFGIAVNDLNIRSGKKVILSIPRLILPRLGIVSVMGPSGCGKSSLLTTMADLHDHSIAVEGTVDARCCPDELKMPTSRFAMIWQQPTVFPCSVWDNLKVPLRKRGVPRTRWKREMETSLEKTGMIDELGGKWWRFPAANLSGGQKQRLCISMGLLKNADIILFDEPTSALDPVSTEKVERIIMDLGREKLVVIVTHSIGQARRLSEYTAMFCTVDSVGVLCEFGPTEQVFDKPSSAESRAFITRETGL